MDFFMLDAGTSTVSCLALFALRMRVSISAMGSVMCMSIYLLLQITGRFRTGTGGKVSGSRQSLRPVDRLCAIGAYIKTAEADLTKRCERTSPVNREFAPNYGPGGSPTAPGVS